MRIIAAVATLALIGCSSAGTTSDSAAPPIAARGLSCESAVVIEAANTNEGIARENQWIRENYPGAKKEGQSLVICNEKQKADAVHIVTANGQKVTIYFDISGWFGKY